VSHHGHDHGPERPAATRRLFWVLLLTLGYAAAEVAGGILSNSLALLADAGHMLTDVLALGLALAAAWFARRPPDPSRTYGYQRAEILAALLNGVFLVVVCVFLFLEAWRRLFAPPQVDAGLMGLVAAGGLLVNVGGVLLLRGVRHGLNVGAAYLHLLGDLLGSVGTLAAALLIRAFSWTWADPVATFLIGGIIIVGSVRLVLRSAHVLMEGAPAHIDAMEVQRCLLSTAGVADLHDLHLWSLAGGAPLLSAHLVVDHSAPPEEVLRSATRAVAERFGILHVTFQIEPPDFNIEHPAQKSRATATKV
jgi:cobalt-zinc-cadmium efflux system protein